MKFNVYKLMTLILCICYFNSYGQCTTSITPPHSQSFENGLASWTNDPNNDINWTVGSGNDIGSNGASDGNNFIYISNAATNIAQTGTLSSCLDLTNCSASFISFNYFFNANVISGNGTISLEVSTDNGASWATFWSLTTLSTVGWQSGVNSNLNLSQYLGQNIQLRFNRTTEPNEARSFGIDNLNITCTEVNTPSPCDNLSISIDSTTDCNTFCGTFTTTATNSYNLNANISTTNVWPPTSSSVQITDIFNTSTNNGILSGDFCITLDENTFDLNNNYQLNAGIGIIGERCSDRTSNIPFVFEECEEDVDPCEKDSWFRVTSRMPECLATARNFNVCGVVTMEEGVSMGAGGMTLRFNGSNGFALSNIYYNIASPVMTPVSNSTQQNGNFCFAVNMNDFPLPLSNNFNYTMSISYGTHVPVNNRCNKNKVIRRFTSIQCEPRLIRLRSDGANVILNLFPNPANDKVSIKVNNTKLQSVEIYNISGTQIKTLNKLDSYQETIDVSDFNKGYYIIKAILQDYTVIHKNLIIE